MLGLEHDKHGREETHPGKEPEQLTNTNFVTRLLAETVDCSRDGQYAQSGEDEALTDGELAKVKGLIEF